MPDSAPDHHPRDAIKVLVVDDHPALREGLDAFLRQEVGLFPVGALSGGSGLADALDERQPDVVVIDYALGQGDGLGLCFRLKQRPAPPAVVLYSAYADEALAIPAALAQADAVVAKSAPAQTLLDAIWAVARGERCMPPLRPDVMAAASARLSGDELPVAGMLYSRTSLADIAHALDLPVDEVRSRAVRIIGKLQARRRLAEPSPALA
jgi:DNA-binding NarL/FixJ family response regulator